MSLIDRFTQLYMKETPSAAEPTATPEELQGLLKTLKDANGVVKVGQLTEEQRKTLRGKSSPLLAAMLAGAAKGLRATPEFAQEIQADPVELQELLEQRMALTGAVKTLEVLRDRADGCWYQIVNRAQVEGRRLVDTVLAVLGPEPARKARQIAVASFFARALGSHEKGILRKSAPGEALAEQKEALDQELVAQQGQRQTRELVRQMLAEIAEGKGLLPAGAPAKGKGKDKP